MGPTERTTAPGTWLSATGWYVLIQTQVGKVAHVAQALNDLDGVESAEDLAGPYDVIAMIQAPDLDQLGRLVASRIQAVDGVTRTLTCTVIYR
jgi:DNA-binding Lrp family transcriptional regulator